MTEIDTRTWRVLARQEQDVLDHIRAGETVIFEGLSFEKACAWCAVAPMPVTVELKTGRRPRWTCAACGQMVPLSFDPG
jgi:hypothetical protein